MKPESESANQRMEIVETGPRACPIQRNGIQLAGERT